MKRAILLAALPTAAMTVLTMSATSSTRADTSLAEHSVEQPMPPGGADDRGPGGRGFGDRDDRDDRGPGDRRDGPHGGRMGPGGMGMRPLPPSAEVMRNYLELVTRYTEIAKDETTAGVSAVLTAADLLRAKGNDAAIAYFENVLADRPTPEIERAIRLQLAELHKASGNTDKALEHLRVLMVPDAPTTRPAD